MIGKKYSLGSVFEPTGEPLVKLANFDELSTQGQDIAGFIKTFKPESQYVYLHVIAMSAGEYWGCNVNGDWFSEADLIARHKTFETHAKVFKEHDNKPYSPDYGKVAFAWYNPKMHRVELILAIDKVKGADIIARQERGEQLCVSMGTRVKYDVCSICGNKASKPTDYCDHIRLHKKEIYPDGKQVYMINPNPTFFDISIVRRPADKTAYCLAKVANQVADTSYSSCLENGFNEFENLADTVELEQSPVIWEIPEDDELLGEKNFQEAQKVASINSKIEKTISEVEKVALDKQIISTAVRRVNKELHEFLPALEKIENTLPAPLLDNLARNFEVKDILKSFLANAIPMKPQEFTRIIIVKKGLPLDAFPFVLEGVLNSKSTQGYIPSGTIRSKISDLLLPFLENRSSFLTPVRKRLKLIFSSTPNLEKTAGVKPIVKNVLNKGVSALNSQAANAIVMGSMILPVGLDLWDYGKEKINNLRTKLAANYYVPNPVMEALDQSPSMNFGYVRRVPEYQDLNGGLPPNTVFAHLNNGIDKYPIAFTPEGLEQEKRRPSLSPTEKNRLIAYGAMAAKDYSAYKNPNVVMAALREPSLASSLALILTALNGVKDVITFGKDKKETKKTASWFDPTEEVLLEHLTNSYSVDSIPVVDAIGDLNSFNDGSIGLVKESSLKNNLIDAAEVILLPSYIAKKAASPVNLAGSIIADTIIVDKAQKAII